ncbi:MAG TPA: response regulator, partial [Thermoanaerobaculia bacterium]|nr:response regulator [Thermoanaerobaculia bacterium]
LFATMATHRRAGKSREKRSKRRVLTAAHESHHVLIVDDDEQVRALLDVAFRRAKLGADLAGSGREAMEILRRRGNEYCCLLLDLNIPPPAGIDIARFVGRSLPELPIIVVSGHPDLAQRLENMNLGAQIKLVMMKPVDPKTVVDYVRGQCARRTAEPEKRVRTRLAPVQPVNRATSHRLLIVDDDPPIRNLLRRLAARAGFDAETAKDGGEAIEKLGHAEYEIVIVDLMMPRVSGFELLEHINTLHPRPTVIVATAMTDGDISRIDDSMIRRVIRKPFDVDAVTKALVEIATELAGGQTPATIPPEIKEIIPGDPQSHADAAAHHAAAAAALSVAAVGEAAAAAAEAKKASDAAAPAENGAAAPPKDDQR